MERILTLVSVLIAAIGIAIGWVIFRKRPLLQMPRILENKYYVDEIYDGLLVRPFTWISDWLAGIFDPGVIDGVVNGVAAGARSASSLWRTLQTGNVQHYVAGFLAGTLALLAYYLGQPQP